MITSPHTRLHVCRAVVALWVLLIGINAIVGIHEALTGSWAACLNLGMVAFIAWAYRKALRPALLDAGRDVGDLEAKKRKERISELEKELGLR